MLKTYIKTNLSNGFICFLKLFADALNFFTKKLNNNFCLCVNYQGLKNLNIKNLYFSSLIGKLLNQLD